MATSVYSVRVEDELRKRFEESCASVDMAPADVIRGFIARAALFPEYMPKLKENIERQEAGADKESLRLAGSLEGLGNMVRDYTKAKKAEL